MRKLVGSAYTNDRSLGFHYPNPVVVVGLAAGLQRSLAATSTALVEGKSFSSPPAPLAIGFHG